MYLVIRTCIRLWRETTGVSYLEFAIILPVMLFIFYGLIEVARYVEFNLKLAGAAGSLESIVNQNQIINSADMQLLYSAAQDIMSPYDATAIQIIVTEFQKNAGHANPNVMCQWQYGPSYNIPNQSQFVNVTSQTYQYDPTAASADLPPSSTCATAGQLGPNCTVSTAQLNNATMNTDGTQLMALEVFLQYKPLIGPGLLSAFGLQYLISSYNYKFAINTPIWPGVQSCN